MKKKVFIILIVVTLIIISIVFAIKLNNAKQNNKENNHLENSDLSKNEINTENFNSSDNSNSSKEYNTEEIEQIKKEINATANTDIYELGEEPGGRKILQVKPGVQFSVDLAGIIKNAKPEENELNELLKKMPNNTGIWISSQSREKFLELLKNNNIQNFSINNEGYLKIDSSNENTVSLKLENMIKSDKLYIINITGKAYERDYITGEIVEYPFEDMDPTQIIEPYSDENKIILEITTNKRKNLTDKEILETIIQY